MNSYLNLLSEHFGNRNPNNQVVDWNGYDQLEKESAVEFYKGKTWQQVLKHLESLEEEPIFKAAYYLEEWSVLNSKALEYYLRAHLEYLFSTLEKAEPDEEFIFYFFGQLYQVVYMHKGSPFTKEQTVLIKQIVNFTVERIKNDKKFYFFELQEYEEHAQMFFDELEKYAC
jgi:hypothetical protein